MLAPRLTPRLLTTAEGKGEPCATLSRFTTAPVWSRISKPTYVRPLPLAVTEMESITSRRPGMVCVTTGPGGAPTRTAITSGEVEPSWPSTSTEMGVMVMRPFDGALAGTMTVAVIVTSLPDGV
jgi:hypothetical protein